MSLRIRPAERTDVDGIRSVARRAWHRAHAPIVGEETVESFLAKFYDRDAFRRRVERDDVVLDVAVDDEVVGYALASPVQDTAATYSLGQIYVAPDRWGDGVGSRLLDHVEATVAGRGAQRVTLGVMAANERAVGFYEAKGYERVDDFHDERIDARGYTYEKDLA